MKSAFSLAFAVPFALITTACSSSMNTPDIKQNPHPKMRYEITVTIDGAPGPFDSISGFMQYEVTNKQCIPLTGGPMNAMRIPPTAHPAIDFKRVSDNVYTGTVYADYFLDEDYFGEGVCHWSLMSATARLKVKNLTLVPYLLSDEIFSQKSVEAYFVRGDYSDNDQERGSSGSRRSSDYPPELQKDIFSITLVAKESIP
ncbi:hypothetical protein [Dyella subtropica]|uniref:hypothetical protein n=1 Tax=Dyella subtropica TaxID=2992127 RepID=UPI00225B6B58|nr:hypothetical protein [Dyella subtropica]